MLDLRALHDDEVIALLGLARGFDRELLVEVLGHTRGDEGVPFLRAMLAERGRGAVALRTTALGALCHRIGTAAVPDVLSALRGGTLETQQSAVGILEELDDGSSAGEVFAWLDRRLHARGRDRTWAHYEVSGILRYATKVGALLGLLDVLEPNLDRLQPDERKILERVWPAEPRRRFRVTGDRADGPDPAALDGWYRMTVVDSAEEDHLANLTEDVEPVITRLRRRHERLRT